MTNGLSSIMFSPYADRIDRLPNKDGYKYNAIQQRRIAGMPSKSITDQIIDLSAQDVPPKEIAAQLGVDPQKVYYVRSHWCGSINARRKEMAGQNIDGTPASVAHRPEGPVQIKAEKTRDLTPEEAFDQIIGVIVPPADSLEPEPIAPSDNITAVGMAPTPVPVDTGNPVTKAKTSIADAIREMRDKPTQLAVVAPVGMQIRAIELRGVAGSYALMADRVDLLDGGIDSISIDKLSEFVNDLNAIQRFSVDWGRVANG